MKYKDIAPALEAAGLPVTYYSWPETQAPDLPYLVWYLPGSDNMAADNRVYQKIDQLNVELYTATKDFETEAAVEAALDAAGLVWEKTETYIDSEHMFEVLYEMEVLING